MKENEDMIDLDAIITTGNDHQPKKHCPGRSLTRSENIS
jgi:hypothetical protein